MENRQNQANINWYPGHMAKAKRLIKEQLDLIDIVYEVIDSRMPYSSKIKDIDDIIKNKPRVLIMTKYDLCDKIETNKWINYYKTKCYSVFPIDLEHNPDIKTLLKITNELMQPINKKRRDKGMLEKNAKVLIIGIPNVGKSTLINRLVGRKATLVGNKPGVTKQLNWIRINEKVELLDTPGILWPKLDDKNVALNLASLSAIREEILPLYDVCEYILRTMQKYYPQYIEQRYKIKEIDEDIINTMSIIGKNRGCLVKGGQVDYDKVINVIMNDIKNHFKNITFDRIENYD